MKTITKVLIGLGIASVVIAIVAKNTVPASLATKVLSLQWIKQNGDIGNAEIIDVLDDGTIINQSSEWIGQYDGDRTINWKTAGGATAVWTAA